MPKQTYNKMRKKDNKYVCVNGIPDALIMNSLNLTSCPT